MFPRTVLGNKVELYYDGAWHNIVTDTPLAANMPNSRVRGLGAADGDIHITSRGTADEATDLEPTQATLSINNKDGKYSPRNTSSDLYGKIGKNTPLRISTDLVSTVSIVDEFTGTRTDTWGVADESGHAWNNTGGNASDYDVGSGVGTHSHAASGVAHFSQILSTVDSDDLVITDFDVYVLGISVAALPTGDNVQVGFRGRLEVFEPNYIEAAVNFTTGNTVTYAVRVVENYTQVATSSTVAVSGATATETMSFRFQAEGRTIRMKCWEGSTAASEPATWGVELATPHLIPGYVMLYSATGASNSNTKPYLVSFSSINASLGIVLFTGEVVEWPKRWDLTGTDVWVPIVAAGVTRRKRQGNRPSRSPLYNYLRKELGEELLYAIDGTLTKSIDHYWPLEGLSQQTRDIRCEIDGSTLLRWDIATHNSVEWGSNDFVVGSGKLVTITGLPIPEGVVVVPFISTADAPPLSGGGTFDEPVVDNPDTTSFMCWFYWPSLLEDFPFLPATSLYFSFAVPDSTIGNIFVDVQYRPDTNEIDVTIDSTSGDLTGSGTLTYTDGPHFLLIDWFVDGSDLWTLDVYIDGSEIASDSASFRPFVHTTRISIETEPYSPVTIGHVAIETNAIFTRLLSFRNTIQEAGAGFPGETAVERFERIMGAEGLAYEVFEGELDTDHPTLMGPQIPGNFIDNLNDISRADAGLIYEMRTPFGYGFRTRQSLYGIPDGAHLELDYANTDLGEVPEVNDDDQQTRNIVRAKRRGGTQGEVTSVVTDGPQGTLSAGDYEDGTIEVALNTEELLTDFVAWHTFLGTWDEDRWPSVTVYLHRAPFVNNLLKWVKAAILEVGEILSVDNKPVWLGGDSDTVLQQMRGVSIRLSNFEFDITWNLIPGGPYAALNELNNPDMDRVDTSLCYLVGAIDDNDTDLIVVTYLTESPVDTPLWTRDPAEFDSWDHAGIDFRINPLTRAGGLGGEKVTVGGVHPVEDTFTRSASQLGGSNADTGQTWVNTAGTATAWTVNGSAAPALHSSANTDYWSSLPVGDWDHSIHVTVSFNFTTATGGQFITDVMLRQTDTNNNYFIRLIIDTGSSTVLMQARKVVAGSGTLLGGNYTIGTNVSGVKVHIRGSVVGRDFYAKAWLDTDDEEPEWLYEGLDAASDVINGTNIGLRSIRMTGNTNTNATSTWDDLEVHTPKIRPVVWDRFAYTALNDPDSAFPDDQTYPTSWNWFTAGLVEADLDFTPNQFQVTASTTNAYGAIFLDQIDYLDGVITVIWTCPEVTGTGGLEPGNIMMRGTSVTDYILFRNFVTADNQIFLQIFDRNDNFLGQAYVPPDMHSATRPMKTKVGCFGDQLMMKCWDPTKAEPTHWQLTVTDPDPQSGWVGLRAGRHTNNTNANAAMTFHEFRMENPQRITVVRGNNGVAKAWDAGSDIRLYGPIRLGR